MDTRLVQQAQIGLSEQQKTALAWALATDGSIALHCIRYAGRSQYPNFVPLLNFVSTDEVLVRKIHEMVGYGRIIHYTRRNPRHRDVWRWEVTRVREALSILEQVRSYLPIKGDQAALVMEFCRLKLENSRIGLNQFTQGRPTLDRERDLYERITTLNRRHKSVGRIIIRGEAA